MALSRPHARPWIQARVPRRLLLVGLAAAVGLGGTYAAVVGNLLTRNQNTIVYNTTPATQGTLKVTVSAMGRSRRHRRCPYLAARLGITLPLR